MNDSPDQPIDCILLPGLHGTNELYPPLVKELKKRATKNSVTLNYQTLSYPINIKQRYKHLTKWAEQAIDLKNRESKIVIIAESFSTPIALRLASAFPKQIIAVVIASGFCSSPANMSFALLPLRPLFMVTPPRTALRHFLLGDNASPENLDLLRSILSSCPSKILSQRLRSVLTLEESSLPSIPKTPLLLLQAQQDGLIPWDTQNQLETHLSHSTTHWMDAPHLLFQTRPKLSAKHIVEFIINLPKTTP